MTTNHIGMFMLAALLAGSAAAQTAAPTASPIATNARWVSGSAVNLRAEPSANAPIVRRLALNTEVRLLESDSAGGYCRVAVGEAPNGASGYTACRYLASAKTSLQSLSDSLLPSGQPNPAFDPVKAFWVRPNWATLSSYATHLSASRLIGEARTQYDQPRPADAELDRMKAYLAKGIYGERPRPYERWPAVEAKDAIYPNVFLWGPVFEGPESGMRLHHAVRAIALPAIRPSLFQAHTDVAPPGEGAAGFSGRFNIIHTYRVKGRNTDGQSGGGDGLWDIGALTTALTRPVARTTLYRDGHSRAASTNAVASGPVYGPMDEPMCEDFIYGFAFGDPEGPMGGQVLGDDEIEQLRKTPPSEKRLMQLVTPTPLPAPSKLLATQRIKLDRDKTGFIAATQFHFDLNVDGVPDLVVWEGLGNGPGHLDGPTLTDDAYHRIAFINIAGQWHLYTVDSYGYDCGC